MQRDAVVEELESVMISGRPEEQDSARLLLSEMGGMAAMQKLHARTSAIAQFNSVMQTSEENIRRLFETTVKEAQTGFKMASIMDMLVFAMGIGLVSLSGGIVLANEGNLNSWVGIGLSGGTGVLAVLYGIVIARPRKQILEAVDHLMRQKVIFLSFLRQLHQVDQAYTRRLRDDKPLIPEEAGKYSQMVETIMITAVAQIMGGKSEAHALGSPLPTRTTGNGFG
jgi:uncharacterized protein (DUF2384 family)